MIFIYKSQSRDMKYGRDRIISSRRFRSAPRALNCKIEASGLYYRPKLHFILNNSYYFCHLIRFFYLRKITIA